MAPAVPGRCLPGGSLADRLKAEGRLGPTAAAGLVGKLARAVQAAHDQGIVHRDLKPGNVLFDGAGEPRVTDFGLAKRAAGSDLTRTQAVMGTPAYMAPEQARGDTKFVGPQADVSALGVVLYECLTGSRPFHHEDTMVLLRRVAEDEPARPSKPVPGLPRDLELIGLRCLAKDAADRYPTAGALAGEPVSVRAAGWAERALKWAPPGPPPSCWPPARIDRPRPRDLPPIRDPGSESRLAPPRRGWWTMLPAPRGIRVGSPSIGPVPETPRDPGPTEIGLRKGEGVTQWPRAMCHSVAR